MRLYRVAGAPDLGVAGAVGFGDVELPAAGVLPPRAERLQVGGGARLLLAEVREGLVELRLQGRDRGLATS